MPNCAWHWMIGCIYDECESCGEPMWDDHKKLVTWRDRNYHLHCLLDKLTSSIPRIAPNSLTNY
jgi:hypothetical protein